MYEAQKIIIRREIPLDDRKCRYFLILRCISADTYRSIIFNLLREAVI